MKSILAVFLAASLFAAPYAIAAEARGSQSGVPPIEQPLVREGDFAVELATALNLASSHDEAAAERKLVSINIMPRNGWISDYPVTPDILAEVRLSAARSASSGNLRISGTEAAAIVDKVSISMNLPFRTGGGKYARESGSEYPAGPEAFPPEASEYLGPSAIEGYYYDNEPPVVTYYPPPWEYAYLYDWVPDPFWWGGFGFGGFFILNDFDRHHHGHHVTNHVANANGTSSRINARTRTAATAGRQTGSRANAADPASRNFSSSRSARDAERGTRDMDRSSSISGRSLGSPAPSHLSTGGGGMGGFHGGGFGGGHGGGGFGGGHGGGGGHR